MRYRCCLCRRDHDRVARAQLVAVGSVFVRRRCSAFLTIRDCIDRCGQGCSVILLAVRRRYDRQRRRILSYFQSSKILADRVVSAYSCLVKYQRVAVRAASDLGLRSGYCERRCFIVLVARYGSWLRQRGSVIRLLAAFCRYGQRRRGHCQSSICRAYAAILV